MAASVGCPSSSVFPVWKGAREKIQKLNKKESVNNVQSFFNRIICYTHSHLTSEYRKKNFFLSCFATSAKRPPKLIYLLPDH